MFGLGWQETVVIFLLALLLFGPKKLPELGKNLAKAMGEFRRASNELKDTWNREMAQVERETQDLRREAENLGTTVATASSDPSSNYDYNYEYGGYGYPDSETSTNPDGTVATAQSGEAESVTPEGVVATEGEVDAAAGEVVASTAADAAGDAGDLLKSTSAPAEETSSAR